MRVLKGVLAFSFGVALLAPGAASAQVTIGQLAPAGLGLECEYPAEWDEVQTSVSGGTSYAAPTGGVLTSWSTQAGPSSGQLLELKVYRPAGIGTFTVVGHDGPRALTPNSLNTFPISIPVQAGDIVGLRVLPFTQSANTVCGFETASPLDRVEFKLGNAPDGASFTAESSYTEWRFNVTATLLPPPTISSLAPVSGSILGGTPVTLAGANFAAVKGVSFGSTPASFTVGSEGQITATSPASKTVGSVPLTVTTVAGTATSAQTFAYEGCVVPKLKGKKLKAAKKRSRKADCKLGKVTKKKGITAKSGKVIRQKPAPGAVLAPGTKIAVKLG